MDPQEPKLECFHSSQDTHNITKLSITRYCWKKKKFLRISHTLQQHQLNFTETISQTPASIFKSPRKVWDYQPKSSYGQKTNEWASPNTETRTSYVPYSEGGEAENLIRNLKETRVLKRGVMERKGEELIEMRAGEICFILCCYFAFVVTNLHF